MKLIIFVSTLIFSISSLAVNASYSISEGNFISEHSFKAEDAEKEKEIHIEFQINSAEIETDKVLVIVAGRSQSYANYAPMISDFISLGYSKVFINDHRGQGYSSRILDHPYKGYVQSFSNYVDDLQQFMNKFVIPMSAGKEIHMLSHSMGGAISLMYLTRDENKNNVSKAIFSNPMWEFDKLGDNDVWKVELALKWICDSDNLNKDCTDYAGDSKDPVKTNYKTSLNTQSEEWHNYENELWFPNGENTTVHKELSTLENQEYQRRADIKIGGATAAWVKEAIDATDDIDSLHRKLSIPSLLIISEKDQYMDTPELISNCKAMKDAKGSRTCKEFVVKDAFHEILNELPKYRDKALEAINSFSSDKK